MKTLVAHVYDSLGIYSHDVISDDYESAEALMRAHTPPGGGMVVDEYEGDVRKTVAARRANPPSEDAVQDRIIREAKVSPPPKQNLCLCGPNGVVFAVVQTRRGLSDPRLRSDAYAAAASVREADLISAKAQVDLAPVLDAVIPALRTASLIKAHEDVAAAKVFGRLDDGLERLSSTKPAALLASHSFSVYEAAAKIGDRIVDGKVHALVTEPITGREEGAQVRIL